MARETKAQIMSGVEGYSTAAFIAPNTVRYTDASGNLVTRLHHTDIIRRKPNGNLVLTSGGWRTPTTKDRLNRFGRVSIYSDRGQWYLGQGHAKTPFFDGIELDSLGKVVNPQPSVARDTNATKKRIKNFVNLIDKMDTLPQPNGGDCWLCMMDKGRPVTSDLDNEHLLSHMDEGYLHGTLLCNAMRFVGFDDRRIGIHYGMNLKATFKRALRRYLNRRLGVG